MSDDKSPDPVRFLRPLFESIKRSRKSGTISTTTQASQQHRRTSVSAALHQSTFNTVHKEANDEFRPFTFLKLPLELQKLVFKKFYENVWSVAIDWSPIGSISTHLSAPHVNPSPVNHHFYEEMRLALALSRSGRLLVCGMPDHEMQFERVFDRPTFCDKAMTKVSLVEGIFSSRCLEVCKRRFANLEVIEVGLQSDLLACTRGWVATYITRLDLLDFVDGKCDEDFLRHTHQLAAKELKYFYSDIAILGDTVLEWKSASRGPKCRCRRRKCPAVRPTLQMVIKTSKDRSHIIERRISSRRGSAKSEDIVAHLRALRVVAQKRVDWWSSTSKYRFVREHDQSSIPISHFDKTHQIWEGCEMSNASSHRGSLKVNHENDIWTTVSNELVQTFTSSPTSMLESKSAEILKSSKSPITAMLSQCTVSDRKRCLTILEKSSCPRYVRH